MSNAGAIEAPASYEERRTAFFDVADRFLRSEDPAETARLRQELAEMIFGASA
jgi:hypothetical protein